jgi:hypothetical protein
VCGVIHFLSGVCVGEHCEVREDVVCEYSVHQA